MNIKKSYLWLGLSLLTPLQLQARLVCEKLISAPNLEDNDAQYWSSVEVMNVDAMSHGAFFQVQRTPNEFLKLTPNNVFFKQNEGFEASDDYGDGAILPDSTFTQGKNYQSLTGWRSTKGELVWPILTQNTGTFQAVVELISEQNGSVVEVSLKDQRSGEVLSVPCVIYANSDTNSDTQWRITSDKNLHSGYYHLSLKAKSIVGQEVGVLKQVLLSGSSIKESALIRARWRPVAVHAQFTSSTLPENEQGLLWVFETEQLTSRGNSYSPISTPFGYIGSTRLEDSRVPSGFNFSLWAFSRGEQPLAFIDMPHIIASGSPRSRFSWYGHEGTGVKIRDWDPYLATTNPIQLLGYRLQPGVLGASAGSPEYYDTFSSYFFDHSVQEWRLFGTARDTLKPSIETNRASAFVEVTGAANTERSGHIPRAVSFKGWVYGSDFKWHNLDQMKPTGQMGSESKPVTKNWSVSDNGDYFILSQTGLEHFVNSNDVMQLSHPTPAPEHIKDKTAENFVTSPLKVNLLTKNIASSEEFMDIEFNLSQVTNSSIVRLYYGEENRLTYTESIVGENEVGPYQYLGWSNFMEISSDELSEGINTIRATGLERNKKYYFRLFSENESGKVWSDHFGVKTPDPNILALFTDFTNDEELMVSFDQSSNQHWQTSNLKDNATGTGFKRKPNQSRYNRQGGDDIRLHTQRENDFGRPDGKNYGESTWFTFEIELDEGVMVDFTHHSASVTSYAYIGGGLGGTSFGYYTLYYSSDGMNYVPLDGQKLGAVADKKGQVASENIKFNLSDLGLKSGKQYFLLDVVSGEGSDRGGKLSQRYIGFDDLSVSAEIIR